MLVSDHEMSYREKPHGSFRKPSDCHHSEREPHLCHFKECPSCKQTCSLPLKSCSHTCPAICHDSVLVREQTDVPNTPWGMKEKEKGLRKALPCPPCQVQTTVFCFGQHVVSLFILLQKSLIWPPFSLQSQVFPCSTARPFCCGHLCNRTLKCQNHLCNSPCHLVTGVSNQTDVRKPIDSAITSSWTRHFRLVRNVFLAKRCVPKNGQTGAHTRAH